MTHAMQETQRTAIIVAGMHRSGTSVTTRIVNLLGAQLARDLIPADIGNERGHWESRAVQDLHNRMLAALGSDLYSPVSIPAGWFGSADARQWTGRIRDLIADEYATSTLFVLKDPRIALFLPLWSEALRQAAIAPRFVLPFRHPGAVATSLEARERKLASGNALPQAQGVAVWLRYVLAAERFTRGHARTFVAFDAVLADWRTEFARMGRQLGIDWPNGQRADAEIDAFLDAGRGRDAGNRVADDVAEPCRSVYACLEQAVLAPDATFPAFDAAAQAVAIAEDLLGSHIVARERVFDDLRSRADAAAQAHDIEGAAMHRRFAMEIETRDARIAEATVHARLMEETAETLQRERGDAVDYAQSLKRERDTAFDYAKSLEQERDNAADYAKSLEHDRDRAVEDAATRERERAAMHARFAAEIEARDARIAEAADHSRRRDETVDLLTREHRNAADYAQSLAQDRERAIEYAQSLKQSRDEAIEYAQALERARDEATRQRRSELLARNGTPVFFTIASRNYLAYATTLMQ